MPELYVLCAKLFTITCLEIVLGIDGIILITVLAKKFPMRNFRIFVSLALIANLTTKIILLVIINKMSLMTSPLIAIGNINFSFSSFVYIIGGAILFTRGVIEIYDMITSQNYHDITNEQVNIRALLPTAFLINFVLALDSVLIGVTISKNFWLILSSMIIAIIYLILVSHKVIEFLNSNLSIRLVAICFMIFLGIYMLSVGFAIEISKKYLYSSLTFSLIVELLNIKFLKKNNK